LQFQLISFAANVSWQFPAADAMRGAMTIVLSRASARNAAASELRK